jgi:hypothetical protein
MLYRIFIPLMLRLFAGPALAVEDPADSTIALSGRVPSTITRSFAMRNYERIWKAVAPEAALDRRAITIVYYSRLDQRKQSVRLPEWGGGGAVGRDLIVIPIDRSPLPDVTLPQVTVHELTHIALERAYGRLHVPRWFHEGLAMTLSGQLSFDEQLSLSRAVFTRKLLPLDSIEMVNRFDVHEAELAYSESHLAVAWMIDRYGLDGIPELLRALRSCGSFDAALKQEYGLTDAELDRLVRNYIVERYRGVFFFSDAYLFWFLGALLAILAFIAVKIRNDKRKRLMEEQECAEDETADGKGTA